MHAGLGAGLDDGHQLVALPFSNQIAHRRRRHQDFHGHHPAGSAPARQQLLRNDPLQRERQLGPDLLLLVGREDVDDPVDGLGGIAGMQGGQHQMAGLSGAHRDADGIHVPHFTDKNHVGIFAQRRPQSIGEAAAVGADFPLIDQAFLVAMQIFDGIFQCDDVAGLLLIDLIDHRGHRRRLAAAGRAGHQYQPPRFAGQCGDHLRQFQLAERRHLLGNEPDRDRHGTALPKGIHPKTAQPVDRMGKIHFPVLI